MEMRSPDAFPDIDKPCRADDIGLIVEKAHTKSIQRLVGESAKEERNCIGRKRQSALSASSHDADRADFNSAATPGRAPRRDYSKADINSVLMPSTQTFSKVSPCCALARFADDRQPEAGVHSGLIGK